MTRKRLGDYLHNQEYQSALVRFGIMLFATAYFFFGAPADSYHLSLDVIFYLLVFFTTLALLIFLSIFWIDESYFRRYLSLIADLTATAIAIYSVGTASNPFILIYAWIFVGYASRYGINVLIVASLYSVASYLVVITLLGLWDEHYGEIVFVSLALILIPFYMYSLLKKLHLALHAAEEASLAKDKFLSAMSHELRTPLSGIIGMGRLLRTTGLNEEQEAYIEPLMVSANDLMGLISDLLDFSKISEGHIELFKEELNLETVMLDACRIMHSSAADKGLQFTLWFDPNIPAAVYGDKLRLRQVIYNLVGNAIKFTDHGEVQVGLKLLQLDEGGCELMLTVSDTGPGIPEDKLNEVFQRFWQLDSSVNRKFGGSGLGTAIVKELVTLMDGNVRVKSRVGEGSTFEVRFQLGVGENSFTPTLHCDCLTGKTVCLVGKEGRLTALVDDYCQWLGASMIRCEDEVAFLEGGHADMIIETRPPNMLSDVWKYYLANHPALTVGDTIQDVVAVESLFTANTICDAARQLLRPANVVCELPSATPVLAASSSLDVLIAEDDVVNRKFLSVVLGKLGHHVVATENGSQAWNALENQSFDLAIFDHRMPGISGAELTRRWRQLERQEERESQMPIIVLSADLVNSVVEECRADGVNEFLAKPMDEGSLKETIDRLVAVG